MSNYKQNMQNSVIESIYSSELMKAKNEIMDAMSKAETANLKASFIKRMGKIAGEIESLQYSMKCSIKEK